MTRRFRRAALTVHVCSSVGWLGAVAAFLALAVAALTLSDRAGVAAMIRAMFVVGVYVVVPLAVAALLTGILQSLITSWGLVRHYWVLAKLLITLVATAVLLLYTASLTRLADLAADVSGGIDRLRDPSPVLHSSVAVLLLVTATGLAVFKPRGVIAAGRRRRVTPGRGEAGSR